MKYLAQETASSYRIEKYRLYNLCNQWVNKLLSNNKYINKLQQDCLLTLYFYHFSYNSKKWVHSLTNSAKALVVVDN